MKGSSFPVPTLAMCRRSRGWQTTLLVAKLALLSRTWTSRTQGICVISHTNAAREEIEKKLHAHPAASAFLGYPHFIGTVTSFLDRFVALPYLRGLGWPMQRVDDDVFAAVALSRWQGKTTLAKSSRAQNGRNRFAIENWVANLELAPDFDDGSVSLPQRLKVKKKYDRQPGPASDSGRELEELKAELVCDGFYRYGDLTELAVRAIAKCPTIVARLRKRFPLVILDEAQDTNGTQLKLLDQIFGEGTAYQRLGDQNQTLYEQDDLTLEGYAHGWHMISSLTDSERVRRRLRHRTRSAPPCGVSSVPALSGRGPYERLRSDQTAVVCCSVSCIDSVMHPSRITLLVDFKRER